MKKKMRRYVNKPQLSTTAPVKEIASTEAGSPSFDISTLLDKASIVLQREIQNLLIESSGGKLQPASAKSLVDYLKLLHTLKAEQADALEGMTDEELRNLIK
jgi:hypothetical protein